MELLDRGTEYRLYFDRQAFRWEVENLEDPGGPLVLRQGARGPGPQAAKRRGHGAPGNRG